MLLSLLLACTRSPSKVDVVLISLDTTRADVLTPEVVPTLTALAAEGVRFDMALAHAPSTLSSHASVFTGLDPHAHRVPRNGFMVPPELPTLAEQLGAAGYQRMGVIGASVLSSETGIDRGFSVWDEVVAEAGARREERRATEVTDRALHHWAERDPSRPTLLFVHYFDAHAPYAAPEPWFRRWGAPSYGGILDGTGASVSALGDAIRADRAQPEDLAELRARYKGEVSYMDAEIGRLLGALGDSPRLVVVFGDHGEGLGEPATPTPIGHGSDVDLWAIHVPWIMRGADLPAGAEVTSMVRLSDVGSTVLALVGLPPLGQGVSRVPEARGRRHTEVAHFAEANQPVQFATPRRWPNLNFERAVAKDGHLLVVAPMFGHAGTLFSLSGDQPRAADRAKKAELKQLLEAWDAAEPGPVRGSISKRTREALEALGYSEPAP